MKKRWKVMLILVAVVCFGISLSYPLTYKMAENSTEATMEKLVELRDAGLAKRGGRGDGRQEANLAEAAEEAEGAEEAGKESAEESGLPAESGQPEGAAPSDLGGEAEAGAEAPAGSAVEAVAVREPEGERSEAAEAGEASQPKESEEAPVEAEEAAAEQPGEASEAEATLEQPTEAEADEASEAEATPEQPSEASEAEATPEQLTEAVEPEGESSEAEATLEQPAEAAEPEGESSEAEATPEQPGEAAEPEGEAEATQERKPEGGSAAQVLPGATKHTFATPVPGPTPVPTPTSMPTPTPEPTATPTPGPTVNRFERSGAVPYEQLTKRTLDESKILPQFQEIYAENQDFVGWITIPDTAVDYPVVQTEDNEYYLRRDFFGAKNVNGQIILDSKCDPYTPSYNLVVSGHSMRSGKMFGRLVNYMNESYWEKHKLVYFDTLMDERTYVVFAAFFSADYDVDETGFRYNADIQYSVDSRQWLREIDENKLYDTGIDVKFGDEFLTLTTCNKAHRSDGRFVVVCRRLREGEEIE